LGVRTLERTKDAQSGKKVPSASWIEDPPEETSLTAVEWQYLIEAYKNNKIDLGVVKKWCDSAFGGIYPEWVYVQTVKDGGSAFWSSLLLKKVKKEKKYGLVVYSEGIEARHYKGEQINWSYYVDTLAKLRSVLAVKKNVGKEMSNRLEKCFPSSSVNIRGRQLLTVSHAFECFRRVYGYTVTKEMLEMALEWCMMGGQWLANILMWCCCNKNNFGVLKYLHDLNWFSNGLKEYIDAAKDFHSWVRNTDCAPEFEPFKSVGRDQLYYLHMLAGRFDFRELVKSDDIENREKHGRVQRAFDRFGRFGSAIFEDSVQRAMGKIYGLFRGGALSVRINSPEEFLAHAFRVGTSGSTSYNKNKQTIVYDGVEYPLIQMSKQSALLTMTATELSQILFNLPKLRTTGVEKTEPSKLRLLLPGDFRHWLIESIALFGGEGSVYRGVEELSLDYRPIKELSEMTVRLAKTASRYSGVIACSDYADYNILHTFDRMKRMWLELARAASPYTKSYMTAWEQMPYNEFCSAACMWCAAALSDVKAKVSSVSPDKDWHKLVRGLWTGWRSTSFINTTHNYAYSEAISEAFSERYGFKPLEYARYLGDDMCGETHDEWTGLQWLSMIDLFGLDAQSEKQLLSPTRAEFLRLMYRNGEEIHGSLCRAISGLVSGDMQTSVRIGGPETAVNINDGLNRWIRRGADVDCIEMIRYPLVKFWAEIRLGKTVCKIPHNLLVANSQSGGLGCSRYGETALWGAGIAKKGNTAEIPLRVFDNLRADGSKMAVQLTSSRVYSVLGKIISLDWREHARPMFVNVLPFEIRKRYDMINKNKLIRWYNRNRVVKLVDKDSLDFIKSKCDCHVESKAVEAAAYALREYKEKGFVDLKDARFDQLASHIVSSASGAAGPIQSLVWKLGKKKSTIADNVIALSGDDAAEARRQLVTNVARDIASVLLVDRESLGNSGLSGLLAPNHMAIWDVAINRLIRALTLERCCADCEPEFVIRNAKFYLELVFCKELRKDVNHAILKQNRY